MSSVVNMKILCCAIAYTLSFYHRAKKNVEEQKKRQKKRNTQTSITNIWYWLLILCYSFFRILFVGVYSIKKRWGQMCCNCHLTTIWNLQRWRQKEGMTFCSRFHMEIGLVLDWKICSMLVLVWPSVFGQFLSVSLTFDIY